ncbi:MAG TPA: ABC transporter ATP-binding protein [Bacillota bacterium]|nr:ABC transporter ATP-binding protein [Bacillota bacterium]
MNAPLIETIALTRAFGAHRAVDEVSLAVEGGRFTTIIGPNGAGKTTLFNLISGLLPPTAGRVLFKGTDVTRLSPSRRVRAGIGRSFQLTNVFPALSAHENVRLALQARAGAGLDCFRPHGRYRKLIGEADAILESVLLAGKSRFPASGLTHGEQRKLELGMVMALQPEVVLLDEPTAGMALEEVPTMVDILRRLKLQGETIMLIEHKMDMVMGLSDRVIVLVNGRVLVEGEPAAVAADPRVLAAYLGGGVVHAPGA